MTYSDSRESLSSRNPAKWNATPLILLTCSFVLSGGIQLGVALLRFGLPTPAIYDQLDVTTDFGAYVQKSQEHLTAQHEIVLVVSATVGAVMYLMSLIWTGSRVAFLRHHLADLLVLLLGLAVGVYGVVFSKGEIVNYGVM